MASAPSPELLEQSARTHLLAGDRQALQLELFPQALRKVVDVNFPAVEDAVEANCLPNFIRANIDYRSLPVKVEARQHYRRHQTGRFSVQAVTLPQRRLQKLKIESFVVEGV